MQPKHPEIRVQLTGQNGNAFVVLGLVQRALKRADVPADEVKQFVAEATAGDYDHLLQTAMTWVDVT
jgi:hypothetical protein